MTQSNHRADALESLLQGQCIGLALRKATRRVTRSYDEALAQHGLTIGQLGILAMLEARPGGSVQGLADTFDMNQSAMSRTLTPLVRDGLITDAAADADRRKRRVQLTDAGHRLLQEAAITWMSIQTEVSTTSSLDRDNLLALLGTLGKPNAV